MTSKSKNPYPESEQGLHQSWMSGYVTATEMECPYSADDGDFFNAWLQGHRAQMKDAGVIGDDKPRPQRSTPRRDKNPPKPQTKQLDQYSTNDLRKELHKRDLIDKAANLEKELKSVYSELEQLGVKV